MSRDPWLGNELQPQSMNGWSYVEGNPVNYVDPSGRCRRLTGKAFDLCVRAVTMAAKSWWWYDSYVNQGMYNYTRSGMLAGFEGVMWWEQNVNRPVIFRTREMLCEFLNPCRDKLIPFLPHGTFSSGVGVLGGAIFAGRGGVEVAYDNQGNIAVLWGIGGGGTSPTGGIAPSFKVTNAPTVDKLTEWSAQLGGSAAKLTKFGGEVVFFKDQEGNKYLGISVSGPGFGDNEPFPFAIHTTLEYDWILLGPYNIRDLYPLLKCKRVR